MRTDISPYHALKEIKVTAKVMRRTLGIQLAEMHEQLARHYGYKNFNHLVSMAKLDPLKPNTQIVYPIVVAKPAE